MQHGQTAAASPYTVGDTYETAGGPHTLADTTETTGNAHAMAEDAGRDSGGDAAAQADGQGLLPGMLPPSRAAAARQGFHFAKDLLGITTSPRYPLPPYRV